MIVRFDKLNRFETPKFVLCNPGSVYSNGLTTNTVGTLIDTSDEEINFNFNALSELRMRVNRVIRDDSDDNAFVNKLYRGLQNRRLIFVEDIGYFSISNVEDGFDGERDYKDITAQSCEVEIQRKNLTYIADGTYKFDVLLELIVSTLPKWVIGHVDTTVIARYRTFEDVDTSLNTLSFMLGDMQEAYECIFVFDIMNRRINVYDQNNYVVRTDIHITKDDFIQNLHIDENADDLYTAISVFGDESLSIAAVNPLGTTTIYNFNHYLDWMSDGLREKVTSWTELQESVFDDYYQKNLEYYEVMTERSSFEAERAKQQIVLDTYKKLRENILSTSNYTRLDDYNEVITENGGTAVDIQYDIAATVAKIDELISATNTTISNLNTNISELNSDMEARLVEIEAIHDSVSISKYFTQEEYDELYDYIFEGQYTDSYITVTESMTHTERFKQMKVLYDRAKAQLEKVSVPTQEFNIDVENFVFVKEFEPWSEQLETGCLINVELEVDNIAALFLASITINYADKGLSFTFGNRYNKFDPKALFDKVLGNINKSSNTIEYIKNVVYPIKDGQLDEFAEALSSSRTLTMNSAIASTNQEVVIDDSGYTGRKVLSDGSFDPRQLKIVHNSIVLTANAWDSSEIAIGEIVLDNGTVIYGINAKTLMGEMIIGGQLNIFDSDGNDIFKVMDDKIEASITDPKTGVSSQITQTAEAIRAEISDLDDELSSEIEQLADSLKLEVSNGETSSTIKLKSDSLVLSSQEIKMTGVVKFSDLSEANGTTVINGANITTGKISAIDIEGCTISGGSFESLDENKYGVRIEGGLTKFLHAGLDAGSIYMNENGVFSISTSAGYEMYIRSDARLEMKSDSNFTIDSVTTVLIGCDTNYSGKVNIGKSGGEVRIYGSLYINDVLYEAPVAASVSEETE